MIAENITKMIGEAMKKGDKVRLSTLQLLSSALNYEFIAKQHVLTSDEEITVVKKEAKKRREAIEAYQKVGATERAVKEEEELKILTEFLPPEMGDEELEKIVESVIAETKATGIENTGRIIGQVMAKINNSVDGGRVVEIVRRKLGS